MGMTFLELHSELQAQIPQLSDLLAERFVQRACSDVWRSRHWSFLQAHGILYTPASVSTGTMSVTKYSNAFQLDAAGIIAWSTQLVPIVTKRQVRFGNQQILSVATYDYGTGAGTFDDLYYSTTNATASYQLYRCYYGYPQTGDGSTETNFKTYRSIYDPTNETYFELIHGQNPRLNYLDQARNETGTPRRLYSFTVDPVTMLPRWEMWPHPTSERLYPCTYIKQGITLSADTDTLPDIIPDELITEGAMTYGCDWASKNSMRYKELTGLNWRLIKLEHEREFRLRLQEVQREDEERYIQSILAMDRAVTEYPIGDADRLIYTSINLTN